MAEFQEPISRARSLQLVDASKLAAILGISSRGVYRLSERGDIPRVRLGRLVRFDPAEVIEALRRARSS